jgi:sensor histidine kinase YesM
VKKQNWKLGVVISLGISLIAISTRLIRMEAVEVGVAVLNVIYNFLFCMLCWSAYQVLYHQIKPRRRVSSFWLSAIMIVGVAGITFLYDPLFAWMTNSSFQLPEIRGGRRPYVLFFRGLLISGLFYFIFYYLHLLAEKQRSMLEVEQLKQAQLLANLSSLKEQLSPHFLFNTLTTLSSLSSEKAVKDYVAELANVYRYVLKYKDQDTATLQQELEFVRSYMYIIKTRLEDAIDIAVNVDSKMLHSKIPPLTLQLLIENAIKHNTASTSRRLLIEVIGPQDGMLVVRNNIQQRQSAGFSAGIGLGNVMQRYQLLFGQSIVIENVERYFSVKLPLV